jgi:putative metallohydrolase (TIGR04338 family)
MSQALSELLPGGEQRYGMGRGGTKFHILDQDDKPVCGARAIHRAWVNVGALSNRDICKRCRGVRAPGDRQKQKVYDAERMVFSWDDDGDLDGSVEAAEAFANKVAKSAWVKKNAGSTWTGWYYGPRRSGEVRAFHISRDYGGTNWSMVRHTYVRVRGRHLPVIYLTKSAMKRRWVILHEIAHWLSPEHEGHGPGFARMYLGLVRRFLGPDEARKLKAAFKEKKVRHQANAIKGRNKTVGKAAARMRTHG